jgi:hypothetical protein
MTDYLTIRPKRGRPIATKTLITQKIRERIAQSVAEKLDPILDGLINAAIGNITLEKTDSRGKVYYTDVPPDTNAARLLLEHTIGRPKETIQHQGALGIVALIQSLSTEDTSLGRQ